jgi:hypothetical protein
MQAINVIVMICMVFANSGGILPCSATAAQVPRPMKQINATNETTPMTNHIHEQTTVNVYAQRRARTSPIPTQRNAAASRP